MGQLVYNISASPVSPDAASANPPLKDAPPGGAIFRVALADKLRAVAPAGKAARPAPLDAAKIHTALEARIAKLLAAGASAADVAATLATELATSVAQGLGIAGDDAKAQLAALFARALAPPGDGGGADRSLADRTRALAQRFIKLQNLAAGIAGDQLPGQQNQFAGPLLDANVAKEPPAQHPPDKHLTITPGNHRLPDTDPTFGAASPILLPPAAGPAYVPRVALTATASTTATNVSAQVALDAPAASVAEATAAARPFTVAAALPYNAAAASLPAPTGAEPDGRRVKVDALSAIAAGGDTQLGRVLTRAVLAAQVRDTATAPAPAANIAKTAVADGATDTAMAKFVRAFEAALGSEAVTRSDRATDAGANASQSASTIALATAPADSNAAPAAFLPAAVPFSINPAQHVMPLPAPPPAAPPVDQSSIIDQVLRGAFLRNTSESSEMRLSLVPETLGDVSVKLIVTAGNVTAHVVAQTAEVRDALVAAQPQLSKSLADAGLKLQSFSVDLSGSGFSGFAQQQQSAPHDRRGQHDAVDDDAGRESTLEAIPSFGPSMQTSVLSGDYNYLA